MDVPVDVCARDKESIRDLSVGVSWLNISGGRRTDLAAPSGWDTAGHSPERLPRGTEVGREGDEAVLNQTDASHRKTQYCCVRLGRAGAHDPSVRARYPVPATATVRRTPNYPSMLCCYIYRYLYLPDS